MIITFVYKALNIFLFKVHSTFWQHFINTEWLSVNSIQIWKTLVKLFSTRRILILFTQSSMEISTKMHLLELSTMIHVVRKQIKWKLVNERPRDISLARLRYLICRVYQSVNGRTRNTIFAYPSFSSSSDYFVCLFRPWAVATSHKKTLSKF